MTTTTGLRGPQPTKAGKAAAKSATAAKWIEAVRLRTLPAGCAGVIAGTAYAIQAGSFKWAPALLCLLFALLAQIASNFANEYFDWRSGTDQPGREGFRRGVAEGDITPRAMLSATIATLGLACCCGLALVAWGGWWLMAVGAVIAAGVLAYSAGPWPLSRVGLGEVAVLVFYGLAAVNLTFWLQTGIWAPGALAGSIGVGLLAANIMVVNNTRDISPDRQAGRRTLAVRLGRRAMARLYRFNALAGIALLTSLWTDAPTWLLVVVALAACEAGWLLGGRVAALQGRALNAVLRQTGVLLLLFIVASLLAAIFWP